MNVRRPNVKLRDRRKRSRTRGCLKRKPEPRTRPLFDHETQQERPTMLNITVALPGVHMAGTDAHHNAHIEVGQHGFALFLAPEAEYRVLDINGTSDHLELVS